MPTAKVTLNITARNATTGVCTISQPVITNSGGNRLRLADATDPNNLKLIAVGKGGSSLDLEFTIPGWTAGTVSFAKKSTSDPDPSLDFNNQSSSGETVTVTDIFGDAVAAGGTLPAWEYSITVSRTVAGATQNGTIDPEIDNELEP